VSFKGTIYKKPDLQEGYGKYEGENKKRALRKRELFRRQ
jgi:hypothetical protein